MKKKFLYISTLLLKNESASIRNIALINGLIENNCEVDALTISISEKLEDKFLKKKISDEVDIIKIPIPYVNKGLKVSGILKKKRENILYKIKNKIKPFLFFPDVYCEAIKNVEQLKLDYSKYDCIISSSDTKTSHFIAQKIILNNHLTIPWIQIWGDPWRKDIGLINLNYFLKKKIMNAERKLLNEATKVFYISELTANDITNTFPNLKKKVNFLLRSYLQKIENQNKNENVYIFSYTGSITNRNLTTLINSIKKYNSEHKKHIELQFYGVNAEEMKIFSQIDFIKIFPRVSFEKVLEVYKNSDVLVYIDNMGDTTQIPGKIYDYFGTNKIILGLYENDEIKNFLERFDRVEFYPNNEEFNLENIINKIGTQKPLEEFSPKYVAHEFLKKIKGE